MSNLNFLHSGGNKVTLSAPDSNPSSDVTLKLPNADGSSGQFLKTNGSGALSFATVDTTIANGSITADKLAAGVGGKVKQIKYAQSKTNHTSTSSAYQNFSHLNVTITPTSSSNILIYQYNLQMRVYRNGGNDAMAWVSISDDAGSSYLAENYHRTYDYGGSGALLDIGVSSYAIKTAGSTSARTYYIYAKMHTSGALELNMANNQNNSAVTVIEVEP